MVNVISVWIKEPAGVWNEIEIPHRTFGDWTAVMKELFDYKKLDQNTVRELQGTGITNNCEKYEFAVKSHYQSTHIEYNQAPYGVKIYIEKISS